MEFVPIQSCDGRRTSRASSRGLVGILVSHEQRLLMSGGRNLPLRGQMSENSSTSVAVTDSLPHLVEQAERSQRRTRAWFHGLINTAPQASRVRQFIGVFRCLCAVRGPGYLSPY